MWSETEKERNLSHNSILLALDVSNGVCIITEKCSFANLNSTWGYLCVGVMLHMNTQPEITHMVKITYCIKYRYHIFSMICSMFQQNKSQIFFTICQTKHVFFGKVTAILFYNSAQMYIVLHSNNDVFLSKWIHDVLDTPRRLGPL